MSGVLTTCSGSIGSSVAPGTMAELVAAAGPVAGDLGDLGDLGDFGDAFAADGPAAAGSVPLRSLISRAYSATISDILYLEEPRGEEKWRGQIAATFSGRYDWK